MELLGMLLLGFAVGGLAVYCTWRAAHRNLEQATLHMADSSQRIRADVTRNVADGLERLVSSLEDLRAAQASIGRDIAVLTSKLHEFEARQDTESTKSGAQSEALTQALESVRAEIKAATVKSDAVGKAIEELRRESTGEAKIPTTAELKGTDRLKLLAGDRTLLECRVDLRKNSRGEPVGGRARTSIFAFLAHVPGFAQFALTCARKTLTVTFSPEVLKGMHEGGFKLMSAASGVKAVAVETGSGRIVELGTISRTAIVGPAAFGLAAWQLLAAITLQHYLHSIEKKLREIKAQLDRLIEMIEREPLEEAVGICTYLLDVMQDLDRDRLGQIDLSAVASSLENAELRCCILAERANSRFSDCQRGVEQLEFVGVFSNAETCKQVNEFISFFERSMTLLLNIQYVRLLGIKARSALLLDSEISLARVSNIRELIAGVDGIRIKFFSAVRKKAAPASSDYDKQIREKQRLIYDADNCDARIGAVRSQVDQAVAGVRSEIEDRKRFSRDGIVLQVDIASDGEITEVRQIPGSAMTAGAAG